MKLISIILTFTAILSSPADNIPKTVSAFLDKAAKSCMSFNYTYVAEKGSSKMTGEGTIVVTGNSFKMTGNGMDVICDGKTRWTVDKTSEEAVIESVSGDDDYASNPALLISRVNSGFSFMSSYETVFQGKKAMRTVFQPKFESNMSSLALYFMGNDFSGAEVILNDGTKTVITASKVEFLSEIPAFNFDVKALPDSYFINDLR